MWPFKKKAPVKPVSRTLPPRQKTHQNSDLMGRSFNASLDDRLNSNWIMYSQTPDNLIFHNLKILRARARDQRYNNDYAKKFISMVKTNVIGAEGVVLQSKVVDQDRMPDNVVRTAIETTWARWQQQCDFKGRLHWIDMQNLMMASVAGDGEILIKKHRAGPFGYELELIDPELLDVTYINNNYENGNRIIHAIELDVTGRPVAYHLQQLNETSQTYLNYYNQKYYVRVPAQDIIHLYLTEFVDQKRGLPWISTGLQRLKMLSAYEDAALVAARIGASQMGFFRSEEGEEFQGDYEGPNGMEMEVEPGVFRNIGSLNLESFNPDYPKGEFSGFMKQCLQGISSGLNVDYNTFANDLSNVNYSSARVGMLETREVWIALQGWLTRNLIQPVFEEWLALQYDLGTIKIPRRNNPPMPLNRGIEYYTPAIFQGRRWKWVDPQKEMAGHEKAIALKITTRSQIIREQGGDPDQVFQELAEEEEKLKALGLQVIPGTVPNEQTSTVDEETDDASADDQSGTP